MGRRLFAAEPPIIRLDNLPELPYFGPMHILAEEILKLKELVGSAIRAINGEQPDLAGASRHLAEVLNFLDEIVEEQPRPVRVSGPA